MLSGCSTPRLDYVHHPSIALKYDGEHAAGGTTPPSYPHTHADFFEQDLKVKLTNLHLEQDLQQGLLEAKPASWTPQSKGGRLPDPLKVAPSLAPPPSLVPLPQWHAAKVLRPPPGLNNADHDLSQVTSLGTVGHPWTCAPACKHVKRKGGCRDGANCSQCHACFWSRRPKPGSTQNLPGNDAEPIDDASPTKNPVMSVGTRGHPHSCAPACKYFRRKQGCRDGEACTQCHACTWHRRTVQNENEENTSVLHSAPCVPGRQQSSGTSMRPDGFPRASPTCGFHAYNGYVQEAGMKILSL
eukprot:TRINITY_DN106465_c0_g1_i1.p1 TRINITY_DN106465_c0_g1~~TRINITY_DN106465_c0_g1_i1.p1  ORF type:complete len:299 (-),score=27.38 TRINITY_DN106465_c0_g1_i1:208-1104(-)